MDERNKVLGIAEVIFPESPEYLFSPLLSRGNRGAVKSSIHEENGHFIIAPEFASHFFGNILLNYPSALYFWKPKSLEGINSVYLNLNSVFHEGVKLSYYVLLAV